MLWLEIPAYAGSTSITNEMQKDATDHPRIRGEHSPDSTAPCREHGSSPHTRGARVATPPYPAAPRIIPAYAGSTLAHGSRAGQWPDHPRIRGEHTYEKTGSYLEPGSSPHTRGARRRRGWRRRRVRIIPAYAGSTGSKPTRPHRMRDHPRIRGEHLPAQQTGRVGLGSSPHTRGARPCGRAAREAGRIIPAYAGSTSPPRHPCRSPPDHPRIRGEHRLRWRRVAGHRGSSPHTRGALPSWRRARRLTRIIPAYAGSTTTVPSTAPSRPDHPRIRGEHGGAVGVADQVPGSSPHTRGARSARS